MPIKFLRDYTVQAPGGKSYKEGQTVKDLSDASELHFVTRGAAAYVEAKGKLTDHEGRAVETGVASATSVVVNVSDNRDGQVGRAGETNLEDGTPQRASSGPGVVTTTTSVTAGEENKAR